MKTIKNEVKDVYEIKKSEFLTYLYPVSNPDEVKAHLEDLRKEHKSATHVCYACILTSPNMEKCSDDGEPDGTAGKPLLELLKKKNLENVLLVVVRYFGGIKLGAGGLIRAYTRAGVMVCDRAEVVELKSYSTFLIKCDIDNSKSMLSKLNSLPIIVEGIEYSDVVKIKVKVETDREDVILNLGVDIERC